MCVVPTTTTTQDHRLKHTRTDTQKGTQAQRYIGKISRQRQSPEQAQALEQTERERHTQSERDKEKSPPSSAFDAMACQGGQIPTSSHHELCELQTSAVRDCKKAIIQKITPSSPWRGGNSTHPWQNGTPKNTTTSTYTLIIRVTAITAAKYLVMSFWRRETDSIRRSRSQAYGPNFDRSKSAKEQP